MTNTLNPEQKLAIARNSLDAFLRGDQQEMLRSWSPTIRWEAPGRSRFAGSREGAEAIRAYFGELMAITGGTLRPVPVSSAGGADGAVIVTRTSAMRDGRALNLNEALIFHVGEDGLIAHVYQLPFDQYAWDEFFG